MKRISLIRHGKSDWDNSTLPDERRPLRSKGILKTKIIAKYLLDNGMTPELLISSHAVRAKDTAKIIQQKLKIKDNAFRVEEILYPGDPIEIINFLTSLDDELNYIALFGHNPAITKLANLLIGHNEIDWIPTSGLVHIKFKIDSWKDLTHIKGNLLDYVTPRNLMSNQY